MEKQICVRCGKESDCRLPLCTACRESLKDFSALAEYLNSFTGSKEDLLWIIGSEISCRESVIINEVKVVNDPKEGIIELVPIEPSSSTVKVKPWLKIRYSHIKQILVEISRLRKAMGIAKQYYGVA